ncbi:hypothetical protein, partial [Staphylococcus aureus]
MIRRPPRSTRVRSSAASDVYKRQMKWSITQSSIGFGSNAVSYTHLRAHETCADLVCRLLLEKRRGSWRPESPWL